MSVIGAARLRRSHEAMKDGGYCHSVITAHVDLNLSLNCNIKNDFNRNVIALFTTLPLWVLNLNICMSTCVCV